MSPCTAGAAWTTFAAKLRDAGDPNLAPPESGIGGASLASPLATWSARRVALIYAEGVLSAAAASTAVTRWVQVARGFGLLSWKVLAVTVAGGDVAQLLLVGR